MNHTPVAGTPCATCHETGKSFTGVAIVTRPTAAQDAAHPPTGDCGTCHSSTTSFTTGVTGKPANHIPTTQACTLCHTSLPGSYKPGVMNHAGISSGCTTCHAVGASGTPFYGVTPLPQGSGHIPTNADCVTCHASTSKFGPGTAMNHAPVAGTPCATCHETGKSFTGVAIVTRPTAAQDPNHPSAGDCGGCHSSTTSFTTGVSGGKPANHIPTTQTCTLCHTNPSSYKPGVMNHSGISSGCTTCHAAGGTGTAFFGVTPLPQGSGHIPTNADCVTCHASTTKFGPGTPMQHTGITGGCATCHDTGKSFTGVTVKTKPVNHLPTGAIACESCHAPGNFTTFAGTRMNHTPVGAMTCMSCHETGMRNMWYGVTVVVRDSPSHHAGVDCKGCHNTTSFDGGNRRTPAKPGTTAGGAPSGNPPPGTAATPPSSGPVPVAAPPSTSPVSPPKSPPTISPPSPVIAPPTISPPTPVGAAPVTPPARPVAPPRSPPLPPMTSPPVAPPGKFSHVGVTPGCVLHLPQRRRGQGQTR